MLLKRIVNVVWPLRSGRRTEAEIEITRKEDVARIRSMDWSANAALALSEARSLAELEAERRRTADSKATIYLAVIAAIIPILSSLVSDLVDSKNCGRACVVSTSSLFFLGLVYLLMSGWWAFQTLKVGVYARVDSAEYATLWKSPNRESRIACELFVATRINVDGVNKKLTCIKMTHEFLLRTFIVFALLIMAMLIMQPLEELVSAGAALVLNALANLM